MYQFRGQTHTHTHSLHLSNSQNQKLGLYLERASYWLYNTDLVTPNRANKGHVVDDQLTGGFERYLAPAKSANNWPPVACCLLHHLATNWRNMAQCGAILSCFALFCVALRVHQRASGHCS